MTDFSQDETDTRGRKFRRPSTRMLREKKGTNKGTKNDNKHDNQNNSQNDTQNYTKMMVKMAPTTTLTMVPKMGSKYHHKWKAHAIYLPIKNGGRQAAPHFWFVDKCPCAFHLLGCLGPIFGSIFGIIVGSIFGIILGIILAIILGIMFVIIFGTLFGALQKYFKILKQNKKTS